MPYAFVTTDANIRSGPGTDFTRSGFAPADTPLTVFGRNEDGERLQVRTPDRSGGWMAAWRVRIRRRNHLPPI